MSAPSALQLRFWRARDRQLAARVPAGDRDGAGTIEPVTVGGYYQVRTRSGRPAWARIGWTSNMLCREEHCTYDPDAERAANDLVIAGADPFLDDPSVE